MPTKPPKGLFDPDFAKAGAKPLIEIVVNLLSEVRNYGIALFAYRPEGADENLAILLPFFHLLEMLDAIVVLTAECAPVPARLQLRSVFEALLTIEYITQTDTIQRAHAYLLADIIDRRAFYVKQDPNTSEGREFPEALAADPDCQTMTLRDIPNLPRRIKNLDEIVAKAHYKDAFQEYLRVKGRRKFVQWYELYGGPKNRRELAAILKHSGSYEILYGALSATAHAEDAVARVLTQKEGGPAARPLRSSLEIATITSMATNFAIEAARRLIRTYRPGEEQAFEKWKAREVMPHWRRLDLSPTPVR